MGGRDLDLGFRLLSGGEYFVPDANSTIGDLDGDGFLDVVVFGESYGNTVILIMNNGAGRLGSIGAIILAVRKVSLTQENHTVRFVMWMGGLNPILKP